MLTILRPVNERFSSFTYEEQFVTHVGASARFRIVETRAWAERILGRPGAAFCLDESVERFRAAVTGADFLCPGYDCFRLLPRLLALRNMAGCRTRLLVHVITTATDNLLWALLRPLLRRGDLVIAASETTRRVLQYLCPDLSPYIRVVGIPVAPPVADHTVPKADHVELTSMTQFHAFKLLHRQIEAMAILRDQGLDVRMNIAGNPETSLRSREYAKALGALVEQKRLTGRVSFCGWIDAQKKGAMLAQSTLLMNLSTLPAESFGMAPVEALGMGIPVVATHWGGLAETIGHAGAFAPVRPQNNDWRQVTATPEDVASAVLEVLASRPSPDACRAKAAEYAPDQLVPRLMELCHEAVAEAERHASPGDWPMSDDAEPAAPATGLLAVTAPLTEMSWNELFQHHNRYVDASASKPSASGQMPENVWQIVNLATLPWTNQLMAGVVPSDLPLPRRVIGDNSLSVLARPLVSGSVSTLASRLVCLKAHCRRNAEEMSTFAHAFTEEEQKEVARLSGGQQVLQEGSR